MAKTTGSVKLRASDIARMIGEVVSAAEARLQQYLIQWITTRPADPAWRSANDVLKVPPGLVPDAEGHLYCSLAELSGVPLSTPFPMGAVALLSPLYDEGPVVLTRGQWITQTDGAVQLAGSTEHFQSPYPIGRISWIPSVVLIPLGGPEENNLPESVETP